jgi:uncharacterized lipoprotein
MTRRLFTTLCLLPAVSLLAACGSLPCGAPHPYRDIASPRPPLQVPPGSALPAPDATFQIPAPATGENPSADPCIITPPKVIQPDSGTSPAPAATTATAAPPARTGSPPVAAKVSME